MTVTGRRWITWVAAALLLLSPLTLLPHLTSSTELARLRNALVFHSAPRLAFDWTPAQTPPDFLLDRVPPQPKFTSLVQELGLDAVANDWKRALAISRHLLASNPRLRGGAIQAPLEETYARIVQGGEGYCADFVRTFQAIAVAAGMPMRAWAFSFDGFGGHGHIVVEIWNRQQGRWQMLDIYNNVYFPGADGAALDALAVREGFLRDPAAMKGVALVPEARLGFKYEQKLRDYYVEGLDGWYLWWGNNPFDQEASASARVFSPLSRSLAQLGGIVQGVHPQAHALATRENALQRQDMQRLGWHLLIAAALFTVGLVLLLWLLLRRFRPARASCPARPRHAR